ncbi:uncharacterized protein MEPE_05175 [Melanopsichium pennsylvanicum]|uniref:PH domain-containing protein n=2 Tax=Melanopsichium pennsylvanicum TaxID=63383 RepID=A0AAJ4XR89_9BASI|nr:conserved hypothetical protein [Melanopsichium pennsylvanicum 4]SNX86466.1 uncharacterized protein MEPE_05175 [Melanopsichium pennsylvanicum]
MAISSSTSPQRSTPVKAFEPLNPPPRDEVKSVASHIAHSNQATPTNRTITSHSHVQFPPPTPRCPKCQPLLQHPCSTKSIPIKPSSASESLVAPAHHVSIRRYIGPLPVPASSAKAIANAIAEDDAYIPPHSSAHQPPASNQPHLSSESENNQHHHHIKAADYALSHTKQRSTGQADPAHTWTHPFRGSSPADQQAAKQYHTLSPPSSPSTPRQTQPLPIPRPGTVARDPSSASVMSNTTFISAHSLQRSALSETEATQRGEITFGLRPSTGTDASPSASRSVGPSKRRLALRNRKSSQSFSTSAPTNASLFPPPSILKSSAPVLSFQHANTVLEDGISGRPNIANARSAENLRIAALGQQRRIGSQGSSFSASAASSPSVPPIALPLLDLPLDEIEEVINDPGHSRHALSSSEPNWQRPQTTELDTMDSQQTALSSDGHIPIPDADRRNLNGSNGTTVIRKSDDIGNGGSGLSLKSPRSFSSGSDSHASNSQQAPNAESQRHDLLHPSWEQANHATTDADAAHGVVPNGSTTLADTLSATDFEDTQQSIMKISREAVGRGLPTKRSLTFSGEPSMAQTPRHVTNSAGVHLSRAVDHPREISRQSRMSRASTAGTFNTIGTVATEGSFGATGEKASTLARKFLAGGSFRKVPKRTDSMQNRGQRSKQFGITRTDSIQDPFASSSPLSAETRRASPFTARRRRTGRTTSFVSTHRDPSRRISTRGTEASVADSSSTSRVRGVQPGAVGTSTGGTKWVGESFQVGKRFWEILNARRDDLQESSPCTCEDVEQHAGKVSNVLHTVSNTAEREQAKEQATKVEQLKQSPNGVITLLAQEAQDISDDKATEAQIRANPERASAQKLASQKGSRDADDKLEVSQADTTAFHRRKTGSAKPSRRKVTNDASEVSIETVHPEEATPVAIEARQGWSEIVTKMSSITGEPGTGLKAHVFDRKIAPASEAVSTKSRSQEESKRDLSRDSAITPSQQDELARLTADTHLKILARSSSLVESEQSSAASRSVYESIAPSTLMDGVAPRISSLAMGASASMTRSDALSHPAPPASVEAGNPELLHQLLRRRSNLGERPDYMPDAASDHAVVIKPVASPLSLTPTRELASPYTGPLLEQDPFPLDATPSSESSEPTASTSRPMPTGLLKAVGLSSSPERKKTVKFDTGFNRPGLKGRFTASLFAGKAEDIQAPPSSLMATTPGDAEPRPPQEVLARPQPNAIQRPDFFVSSSPDSEVHESETSIITRKSVIKKDRMLVKIAWTPDVDIPSNFDELLARKYPIREEEWREFVVVLRMRKLELWTDPSLTNKLTGHGDRLKLQTTIALSRGSTFVSLFSPVDRIFCLTFQPWKSLSAHHKRGIHLRRQGTDIVLFNCRAGSAAADWIWELWRELGGLIPESLEVHVPSFGLKVRFPVPETMPVERAESLAATPGSQLSTEKGLFALSSISQSQDGGEGFKLMNRSNIIAMTWKLFSSIEEWRDLMALSQQRGLRLELAWRRGNELDWVINERTVENHPRHWAVLCGALLRDYKHPAILELRAAAHYPTSVLVAPNQYLQEPPAVEGFLWRVKPVSGALTRLYLTTYDGSLYICRSTRAFPPDRHLAVQMQEAMDMRVPRTSGTTQGRSAKPSTPATKSALARALAKFISANNSARRDEDVATLRQNVLEAISYPAETEEEFQGQIEAYQSFERRRQFEQIRGSDGFVDLKMIHTIKTIGSGPVRCPGEDEIRRPAGAGSTPLHQKLEEDLSVAQRDGEESDDEDESHATNDIGGQEGLEAADDPNEVRRARQIEILLTNGKAVRLEAFSAPVAREWVERISDLVKYWRCRERADATELMYAAGIDITELHKQLSGRHTKAKGTEGVDEQRLSPILGNIWNWCQIEGCRNIIRSGRLFHKKSSYSAFKARDYVLIAGRLLCFKLVKSVRTTRARQNNGIFHRRQDTVIHLRDAYVYSGKLSEDMLKNGRSDPAQAVSGIGGGGSNSGKRHRVPRVYADGLFSVDDDEDCTFVIRYRPERVNAPADPNVASLSRQKEKPKAKAEVEDTAYNVPKLDDKTHKYIAMRARSQMERDLWVRCIKYEIEKIVRDDVEREKKLKNTGRVDSGDK